MTSSQPQQTFLWEEFGVDPAPGQVKQLRVQYQSTPRSSFRLYTGTVCARSGFFIRQKML